jgi:hypothetical protein
MSDVRLLEFLDGITEWSDQHRSKRLLGRGSRVRDQATN